MPSGMDARAWRMFLGRLGGVHVTVGISNPHLFPVYSGRGPVSSHLCIPRGSRLLNPLAIHHSIYPTRCRSLLPICFPVQLESLGHWRLQAESRIAACLLAGPSCHAISEHRPLVFSPRIRIQTASASCLFDPPVSSFTQRDRAQGSTIQPIRSIINQPTVIAVTPAFPVGNLP